jgi:4-hydroxybenzoate polyprenyltransferase
LYGLAVLSWVSGFDIIYALQDATFDQENRLYSMPSFFGGKKALRISESLHVATAILMLVAGWQLHLLLPEAGWLSWVGTAVFLGLLIYQHTIVKVNDLSRVNLAFFTTNGIASVLFGIFTITDLLLGAF